MRSGNALEGINVIKEEIKGEEEPRMRSVSHDPYKEMRAHSDLKGA